MSHFTTNLTAQYKAQSSAVVQYQEHLPGLISGLAVTSNHITLRISPSALRYVALYLRNSTHVQATSLVDIVVVDRIGTAGRFTVKYLFLSFALQARLTLSFSVSEVAVIPSLAAPFAGYQRIFAAAGWLEREVWDLFGLYFAEHGDLRRLLTDYGFTGHPLRKDFPLTGFHELSYNDLEGRVVIEPVELSQELRVFRFYAV